MDIKEFIEKRPSLYHLTDRRNIKFIFEDGQIHSTVKLIELAKLENGLSFLKTKRECHFPLSINQRIIFIRDQRPLNAALDKCLNDGWVRGDFILHLNKRVFMWPTLQRLNKHFNRYASENPVILRFDTKELFQLNDNVGLSDLNSGATRPIVKYDGKAPPRGKNTFKSFNSFHKKINDVAEVTFEGTCILGKLIWKADNPNGPWKKV